MLVSVLGNDIQSVNGYLKSKLKLNTVEKISNAINLKENSIEFNVSTKIRDFYTLNENIHLNLNSNTNPMFLELINYQRYVIRHTIEDLDSIVEVLLTNIRYKLYKRYKIYLKNQNIIEYYLIKDNKSNEMEFKNENESMDSTSEVDSESNNKLKIIVKNVNLNNISLKPLDYPSIIGNCWNNIENIFNLFHLTKIILNENNLLINYKIQINSMFNQLFIKFPKLNKNKIIYNKIHFLNLKNKLIPRMEDITFQSLFLKCIEYLTFEIIYPPIHIIFNGPLYHYLCQIQFYGNINQLTNKYSKIKNKNKNKKLNQNYSLFNKMSIEKFCEEIKIDSELNSESNNLNSKTEIIIDGNDLLLQLSEKPKSYYSFFELKLKLESFFNKLLKLDYKIIILINDSLDFNINFEKLRVKSKLEWNEFNNKIYSMNYNSIKIQNKKNRIKNEFCKSFNNIFIIYPKMCYFVLKEIILNLIKNKNDSIKLYINSKQTKILSILNYIKINELKYSNINYNYFIFTNDILILFLQFNGIFFILKYKIVFTLNY